MTMKLPKLVRVVTTKPANAVIIRHDEEKEIKSWGFFGVINRCVCDYRTHEQAHQFCVIIALKASYQQLKKGHSVL